MLKRKGIILAGGNGTRLYPSTLVVSKQLLPVYDKPLIYYPLSTLMLSGIRDILIISTSSTTHLFQKLLGNGQDWGLSIDYAIQPRPEGIAQSLIIGEQYLNGSSPVIALGDNIFIGNLLSDRLTSAALRQEGATIFSYQVNDPQRYGVITLNQNRRPISIQEKPLNPTSSLAVTGLYFYDANAVQIAHSLLPSSRGELEITDVNLHYLMNNKLNVECLTCDDIWFDAGVNDSLLETAQVIKSLQTRQGSKICCPEEIAWRKGWINDADLIKLSVPLMESGYGKYLLSLLN